MRSKLTTFAEAVGLVCVSVGSFLISAPVGFIATGGLLVGLGYLIGGDE